MISEPDETNALDTRRARRQARRRQRVRRGLFLLGSIVGLVAITGSALAFTGVVDIGRDSPPANGPSASPSGTIPTAIVGGVETPDRPCRSPLNPLDPLRLWIGGDSLAGSLGPSLGRMTADTGVVQPVFFSKVSSGLSSPEFWDWPEHSLEEMFKLDPEVAVFIVGANDTVIVGKDASSWQPDYERVVEEMMEILIGENRTVYWVGAPVLKDDNGLDVAQLNQVFQDVADRHPEVIYVDAYALFATPDGRYTPFVPDGEGETIEARADDGVHFTPDGGDHLAKPIFLHLESICSILDQAVLDSPKDVIETEGSSRVPGTSREEDTVTTTAPSSTSPPVTDPPVTDPPTTTTEPPITVPSTILPDPDSGGGTGTGDGTG